MIAVDTNILVHAHRVEAPKHAPALARLRTLAEGDRPWAIPLFCLGEFLRVITHPRVLDRPHRPAEATEAVDAMLASPTVVVLYPGERFPRLLAEAMLEADARGNLVHDAQIVALCREWGVERLLTEDADFRRWKGVRVEGV